MGGPQHRGTALLIIPSGARKGWKKGVICCVGRMYQKDWKSFEKIRALSGSLAHPRHTLGLNA
jgi:hypothetical protein